MLEVTVIVSNIVIAVVTGRKTIRHSWFRTLAVHAKHSSFTCLCVFEPFCLVDAVLLITVLLCIICVEK